MIFTSSSRKTTPAREIQFERPNQAHWIGRSLVGLLIAVAALGTPADAQRLELKPHDRIMIVGNTFAERMQHFGYFETLLHARFPEHQLVVRNLGWSADEITLRPRSQDFADHGHRLEDHEPSVVIGCWGFNESFVGERGLETFQQDLREWIASLQTMTSSQGDTVRVALFSPIAHEDLSDPNLPDGSENNERLARYTAAMREVASEAEIPFVDLFEISQQAYESSDKPLTINGIHLSEHGYAKLAPQIDQALFGDPLASEADLDALRAEVNEKNLQFWYDYRAVNGFYIYGGRKNPFGVVNFPAEFAKLRKMIAVRDERIWKTAQGESLPDTIDDSATGDFVDIQTNFERPVLITSPEQERESFKVPEGFQVNLFASERDFPELENPVQFCFDDRGRLWVATMESYPMYLPGTPPDDKILILEDTDGDGRADKQTVFADGLHLPTGIELGYGGCFVAQQPNLMFLKDTDGDDVADEREIVLHGFDSADSHHSLSAFTWGPDGALYFQEGTFHHTQVETPYGPQRVKNGAVFRYEPRTERFGIFVSYSFNNPWGHTFDDWGQNFVADASDGANYFGTAFSGDVVYPQKHPRLKQFFTKQWRPTSGCELVSSRNFPESWQGNYLLNNCIGFQGVLNYRIKDEGSGFTGEPMEPLLESGDSNCRPVDLQFGPDGALYVVDWFNPLVGHMQHSLRDPNRDKNHGRIWRVTYAEGPLVETGDLSKMQTSDLVEMLAAPETRTRYRVRRELWERPTDEVLTAAREWLASLDGGVDLWLPRHRLEVLWLQQAHNRIDVDYLKACLRDEDRRVRAAATRVLCYQRYQIEQPLELLQQQVNDEDPRVRLEAIRALSFFAGPEAEAIVAEAFAYEIDDYIDYTLNETLQTLQRKAEMAESPRTPR